MRIVELCAGYGGLGLGIKIAVPHARVVGIIERQAYPVARWLELVETQEMEQVAMWPDLESFVAVMARRNRRRFGMPDPSGTVDILCAGFPCQPHSHAGQRRGSTDQRWIWPAIRRAIGLLRPRYVFLENVDGLLTDIQSFRRVLGDLSASGFDAEWDRIPAADAGANHYRFRVFIFGWRNDGANPERQTSELGYFDPGERRRSEQAEQVRMVGSIYDADAGRIARRTGLRPSDQTAKRRRRHSDLCRTYTDAADTECGGLAGGRQSSRRAGFALSGRQDDATEPLRERCGREPEHEGEQAEKRGRHPIPNDEADATGARLEIEHGLRSWRQVAHATTETHDRRDAQPATGRMDDGLTAEFHEDWYAADTYAPEEWLTREEPDRAEQLHALGNGVVPIQAALALTLLARRAGIRL